MSSEFDPTIKPTAEAISDTNADVCHDMQLNFVDKDGGSSPIGARFLYSQRDPHAVAAVFDQQVKWVFARDLLDKGRYEPTGDGDVHVWPSLSAGGNAVVVIELFSPSAENDDVLMEAPLKAVADFVQATEAVVPLGQEQMNFDSELEKLLSQ